LNVKIKNLSAKLPKKENKKEEWRRFPIRIYIIFVDDKKISKVHSLLLKKTPH